MLEAEGPLRGRRILVVEDNFIIADEMVDFLRECGAEVLGPANRLDEAFRHISAADRIDAAVLDVNLGGQEVWPVLEVLQTAGTPVLVVSGYNPEHLPVGYTQLPILEKPADLEKVHAVLARLIEQPQ